MLEGLQRRIGDAAADAGRRAAFGTAGLVFVLVGVGFFTVAAWIALVHALSPLLAACIIGAVYAGVGFILFGLAARHSGPRIEDAPSPPPPPPRNATTLLAEAFLTGVQAAVSARRETPPER